MISEEKAQTFISVYQLDKFRLLRDERDSSQGETLLKKKKKKESNSFAHTYCLNTNEKFYCQIG